MLYLYSRLLIIWNLDIWAESSIYRDFELYREKLYSNFQFIEGTKIYMYSSSYRVNLESTIVIFNQNTKISFARHPLFCFCKVCSCIKTMRLSLVLLKYTLASALKLLLVSKHCNLFGLVYLVWFCTHPKISAYVLI